MKKSIKPLSIHSASCKNPLFCHKSTILALLSLFFSLCICSIVLLPQIMLPVLSKSVAAKDSSHSTPVIIIDAGHGGNDPGKVGTAGTLEKDINLKIALYLKNLLETQEIKVIMTRDNDEDLSTDSSRKKISDMRKRISLIQESNADIVVSIHQNSYTNPKVCGAQCFYHTNSTDGKKLAFILQNQIITSTNQTKIRDIKSNADYYLLKHSALPTVIVECGFLSNPEEEKLLQTDIYQRKMAWAIHLGILQYINQDKNNS